MFFGLIKVPVRNQLKSKTVNHLYKSIYVKYFSKKLYDSLIPN